MLGGSHEYHLEYPPGNKSISHQTGKPENHRFKVVFWGPGHGTIPRMVPSLKLTVRTLKIDPLKRRILLETIFRCYVSFRGGNPYKELRCLFQAKAAMLIFPCGFMRHGKLRVQSKV